MKRKRLLFLVVACLFAFAGCVANPGAGASVSSPDLSVPTERAGAAESPSLAAGASEGKIILYGEMHAEPKILEKEVELWNNHYHNEGMRHLFIELPYYDGELLNLWMQADNDELLSALYEGWGEDAAMHDPAVLEFYRQIKADCPETVFHGTDVGHDRYTNGMQYLDYLETNGSQETEPYNLTLQAMEQGERYTTTGAADHVYRENVMVENFIREFEALDGERVMGIYGGAHTDFDAMDYATNTVPCMAAQLKERYEDAITTENLAWAVRDIEPMRIDTITVGEKEYEAAYFGWQDVSWHEVLEHRNIWRLEDAYDDFKDMPLSGDYLPDSNYPMLVDVGQVFLIEYTLKDGSRLVMYYRSDGERLGSSLLTTEFVIE